MFSDWEMKFENDAVEAVMRYGFDINKEELEKALTEDTQITSRITHLAGKHNVLFALSLSVDFI